MQTLKILVVGAFNSGRTSFIQSMSEIPIVSAEKRLPYTTTRGTESYTVSLDYGRLTVSESLVLYYFGSAGNSDVIALLEVLNQHRDWMMVQGIVMMVHSLNADRDRDVERIFHEIPILNCPYLIALSRQDLPNARTPEQIRKAFAVPDDIKVLGYDWKDPRTTKQVVLELLGIMPQSDLVQQAIAGMKAQIEREA